MATKRPAEDAGDPPPAKKPSLLQRPLDIGAATGEEELSINVLQIQNRKLSERLRERNHQQDQLEARVLRLEHDRDQHMHLLVTLRSKLKLVREHLNLLLAPLGESELLRDWREGILEELGRGEEGKGCLETVFRSVLSALHCLGDSGYSQLCEALRETGDAEHEEKVRSLHSAHSKMRAVLSSLQRKANSVSISDLEDELSTYEARCDELKKDLSDSRFDLQRARSRCDRLEVQLAKALEELEQRPESSASPPGQPPPEAEGSKPGDLGERGVASSEQVEQLQSELAEQQAVGESRLHEIAEMSASLSECRKEVEVLRTVKKGVSDDDVRENSIFKSLQLQYSMMCQENQQLRTSVEDMKKLLNSARSHHFMQLEEIRQEELKYQLEVRDEMEHLQSALASVKQEYETLRIEFERVIASNDQAAPIAKELQVMVDSLQKTIQQLKSEVSRYKERAHKAEQQLAKDQEERSRDAKEKAQVTAGSEPSTTRDTTEMPTVTASEMEGLREKVKKLTEEKAAMEVQMEALKNTEKEEREVAEVIAAEKRARAQIEDLKRKFEDYRRDYEKRKEHLKEESARRARAISEDNRSLQKELAAKKHEAQALFSEMESTAQAFEEMQEQNIRLLQQLKEKEDANFKLMSDRIKHNSVQKLLREEKELMEEQVSALHTERARLSEMVAQLEERERSSEATIQSMEKELTLRQQATELHKRKAMDRVQGLMDSQGKLSDVEQQLADLQKALHNKIEEMEKECQLHKRSQEEVSSLKRKLDKYKTREWASSGDEVLLEEIKTYKAKLNCPCCSTRKKDTVLTKCFHVFCSECIRSRYDSRLRKCPKCGAAFGANDFHKIYLS